MNSSSRFGLRGRLLLVVAIAAVPALAFIGFSTLAERRAARARAAADATEHVEQAIAEQTAAIGAATRLLTQAAQLPEVLDGTSAVCTERLRLLEIVAGGVVATTRAQPDGDADCSTVPVPDSLRSMRGYRSFERALAAQGPVLGDYTTSRRSGELIQYVSIGTRSADRSPGPVLETAILSPWVGDLARFAGPAGVVAVWDLTSRSLILRHPVDAATLRDTARLRRTADLMSAQGSGVVENTDLDGVRRVWAFAPLPSPTDRPALVAVGLPLPTFYEAANASLRRSLFGLVLGLLIAALLARRAASALVLAPVRQLVDATERMTAGDLTARARLDTTSELGELGTAFDRMAERLDERQRELTLLVETSPDIIARHAPDGRLIFANGRLLRVLGLGPDALPLALDDVPVDAALRTALREGVASVVADAQPRTLELPITTAGVTGQYEVRLVPEKDETGAVTGVLTVTRDLTERRALEQQLRQAQKMESVGQLAGGVAHDFNNQLTAIIGNTEVALESLPADHPVREDLERVLAAAQRSSQVTRQLLSFARRRVMSVRATDLNRVVLDARALLAPLLGAHVEIRLATAANLPAVSLDPAQFEQVIVNLALNARDAMPDGGTLRLETSLLRVTRSDPLTSRGVASGTYAVVTVADTGHGMPADVLARAFEPFFTTKPVGSGTGLGLSMVYGTLQQHGGTVLVDSAPGAGTTFRLFLPVRADATPAGEGSPDATSDAAPAAEGRGEAVLLVEDEAPVRALLARVLRRRGYRVAEASNGADALERVRAGAYPDLALLITDLVMPRLGGVALARAVRADHPHLPILLLSGYSRDGVPEALLADPAIRFLEKPLQADALLHAVRSLVDTAPTGAPR